MDVEVRLNACYTFIHMGMSCQLQAPAVLMGNLYVTGLVGSTTLMIQQTASNLDFSGLVNYLNASHAVNTLRTGSFKLFKRPLPGFLTILTL